MARTLSGNLDTFSLADLLQWLEINALSGRVTVWRGEVLRTIDLKGGAIVFVSSSLPNERLGVYLTRRKVLSEASVYELLAESFATGKNLTRLILERNLLAREKLAEAVEGLAMKILLDLFHWAGASFEFDPLFKIEDLIRIHLSLRGQVLAFHGAKSVDDSRVNLGTRPPRRRDGRPLGEGVQARRARVPVLDDLSRAFPARRPRPPRFARRSRASPRSRTASTSGCASPRASSRSTTTRRRCCGRPSTRAATPSASSRSPLSTPSSRSTSSTSRTPFARIRPS